MNDAEVAGYGFAKGFFEARKEKADKLQEKQDKLTEKMQEMAIKGQEKRIEEYDKRAKAYDLVETHLRNGDTNTAMAVYSSAISGMGAKEMKDALGHEFKLGGTEAQHKVALNAAISRFRRRKRPTFDMEAIDNIQVERGVDKMEMESWLRDTFGLRDEDAPMNTPYKGVKNGSVWKEGEGGEFAGLWERVPEGINADNVRLDVYDKVDPETGETRRASRAIHKVTGQPLGGETVYGEKSPPKPPKALTAQEQREIDNIVTQQILRLGADEKTEDFAEQLKLGIGGSGETPGPLYAPFYEEVRVQRTKPGTTIPEATRAALDKVAEAAQLGFIYDGGWFGEPRMMTKPEMKTRVKELMRKKVITPDQAYDISKRYGIPLKGKKE